MVKILERREPFFRDGYPPSTISFVSRVPGIETPLLDILENPVFRKITETVRDPLKILGPTSPAATTRGDAFGFKFELKGCR